MEVKHAIKLFLCFWIHISFAQESRFLEEYSDDNYYAGAYRHVYPPTNISANPAACQPNPPDVICPLFFSAVFGFGDGGSFSAKEVVPAVQLAIDQMNNDTYFLSGYRLHYLLGDSNCTRSTSLTVTHTHILQQPTKLGFVGSGCSVATEASAEIVPFYNLTQIACLSSSTSLANRVKFPSYFQISPTESVLAYGFYGIIRAFGWRNVGILTQDENLFTVTMNVLQGLLREFTNVTVIERRFDSVDGIDGLGDNPFAPNTRVFVLSMFPTEARAMLCKAQRFRIFYPRALLLVVGWYGSGWWIGSEAEQEELLRRYDCTVKDREQVINYMVATQKAGRLALDNSRVADSGINGFQIEELFDQYRSVSRIAGGPSSFYQQCYDATWSFGRALNMTLHDLRTDPGFATEAASFIKNFNMTSDGPFGLHHFAYNNSALHRRIFENFNNLSFEGIVGPIQFDSIGMRIVDTVNVRQYRETGGSGADKYSFDRIADIQRGVESEGDTELIYLEGENDMVVFPLGIPFDGTPNEEDLGIAMPLTGTFMFLALVGIFLALVGIFFQCSLKNKKVIRLSSPNLNFMVGLGAIILYADIIVTVMPGSSQLLRSIECNLGPWLTALGYSLCYGTVLVKMARVYYIFDDPSQRRKKPLQDWLLALGVGFLVLIDFIILAIYTLVEGLRGNLEATRIPNEERLQEISGDTETVTNFFVYVCQSQSRSITLGVLYGYKMVPQVVALVCAFSIRKIKVKGLDDAKYIAFSVYITSLITAIVIVITYTLVEYINIYAGIFCIGFFIGTTVILGLVMVPPVYAHFQDPLGKKVFPTDGTNAISSSESLSQHTLKYSTSTQLNASTEVRESRRHKKMIESLHKKISELEEKLVDSSQKTTPASQSCPLRRQDTRESTEASVVSKRPQSSPLTPLTLEEEKTLPHTANTVSTSLTAEEKVLPRLSSTEAKSRSFEEKGVLPPIAETPAHCSFEDKDVLPVIAETTARSFENKGVLPATEATPAHPLEDKIVPPPTKD